MQFCQPHWDTMRKAVADRGMSDLVAKDASDGHANMLDDLLGCATIQNWDPLMAAHWNIASKVMEGVGLAALNEGFCPLCAVQESYDWWDTPAATGPRPKGAGDAQNWIDGCMDAMLGYAVDKGLVSKP